MTTLTTAAPTGPAGGGRLRWAVADALALSRRNLTHLTRDPGEIAIYFSVPIMFVLVFGYILGGAMAVPDGGSYREFLLPGIFVLATAYGIAATATAIANDVSRGVVDRFRSLPVARSALVAGRAGSDLVRALLEVTVLVVCGLLAGWQWRNGLAAAGLAVVLILLLRFALTWVGIYAGLVVGKPELAGIIVIPLIFPLTALSNIFAAPGLMPGWLGTVAEWNPFSATVAAARELFGNPGVGGDSWAAQHPLLLAVLWPVALILVFAPLAVRHYRRLSR